MPVCPSIMILTPLKRGQTKVIIFYFLIKQTALTSTFISCYFSPDIVKELHARIKVWNATAVPPANKPDDPRCDPKLHGGFWGPWINLTHVE